MLSIVRIVFGVIKLAVKIILLPVAIFLTLLQCVCAVTATIAGRLFDIIGFICIMTGILSAGFRLDPAPEVWRSIAIGAAFCTVPRLIEWLAVDLAIVNMRLKSWLIL